MQHLLMLIANIYNYYKEMKPQLYEAHIFDPIDLFFKYSNLINYL